jgi:hypothetical protein
MRIAMAVESGRTATAPRTAASIGAAARAWDLARSFPVDAPSGTARDFDFLHGRWSVSHRKLDARGVGSSDWRTWSGTAETRPLLGGLCNVEEHRISRANASGIAIRCFDEASGRWAIYWISEQDGKLQPPVYGGFRGDEGLFGGVGTDDGRLVDIRFVWRRLSPDSASWEQAFSYDQGRTWETNWTMAFDRIAG